MTRDIDEKAPPFRPLRNIQRLAADRSGHASTAHVRHHLFMARDPRTRTGVLIKLTSKPGLVYERNLENEIASLSTINRELPDSPYFPFVHDHGRLPDGRVYLITSLFDELPLAASIGTEWIPDRLVGHLRTALAVAKALVQLHSVQVVHVDLNPMNILYRSEKGQPVIRIVDFESSYQMTRQAGSGPYDPPTTPRFAAPELPHQAPDGRADVYSFGAVIYTMLTGYQWTWEAAAGACVEGDPHIDPELKDILRSALHEDPGRRCPTIGVLRDALTEYLEHIWPGRPADA